MDKVSSGAAPGKGIGGVINTSVELPHESITVVAARPARVSQWTVGAHFSLDPRGFLEVIRAPGFPVRVIKLRKLRLVPYAEFLAWLTERASETRQASAGSSPANDAEHDSETDPDASLRQLEKELGLERTKPGPKRAGGRGRP